MKNPFTVGQRVRFAGEANYRELQAGECYTITNADQSFVSLEGKKEDYFYWRFDAVKTFNRDKSGRFISAVSTNSKPISTNNIIPFPTMAKSNFIPTVLKKGSIYKVVGRGFAHFKQEAYDDYVIMTRFGKPAIINKSMLRIADSEDVMQFVADEHAVKHRS